MSDDQEALAIVERARALADARWVGRPRTDYDALNRMIKRQRAALTRAVNSADSAKVVVACRDAVREWDAPGAMWPDDWAHWQRALDDALGYGRSVDLGDLDQMWVHVNLKCPEDEDWLAVVRVTPDGSTELLRYLAAVPDDAEQELDAIQERWIGS